MRKIYYQKDTGYLCERYPYDIPIEDKNCFIEVEEEVYQETLCCQVGKTWAFIDGKLQIIEMPGEMDKPEVKEYLKQSRISELQQFLDDTDYIIVKLSELRLEDEEAYQLEKEKYSETLLQRKQARQELNNLKQ